MIGIQVEYVFVAVEVGKRVENENYEVVTKQKKEEKVEVEKEALSKDHNKDVFNIFF